MINPTVEAHGKNKSLNQHDLFFETMKKAYERKSLMTSAINVPVLPCSYLFHKHSYKTLANNNLRLNQIMKLNKNCRVV